MSVTSAGFNSRDAEAVEQYVQDAVSEVGVEFDIHVEPLRGGDRRADASASADILRIREYMLPVAAQGHRLAELKARFVVYEEVAHLALEQAGVPHGGFAEFVQELFGAWVQYHSVISRQVLRQGDLVTTPLPPKPALYELGKHIGASFAGSRENEAHLEDWLNDPRSDEHLQRLARIALEHLSPPLTLEAVYDFYETTRDEYG